MVKDIRVTNEYAKRMVDAVRGKRGLKTPTQAATQMLIERAQQLGVDVVDAEASPATGKRTKRPSVAND